MFRNLTALLLLISLVGCSALSSRVRPEMRGLPPGSVEAGQVLVAPTEDGTNPEQARPLRPAGLVFGKTVFEGLLKKAYVRLTIVSRDDPAKRYFFIVGDKANQSIIPWNDGRVIEPGYFYLELPQGAYEITAIAIPVGTTIAEESVALDFDIVPDRVNYLGTLDVNGTRERAKFGGVPVVQPGFEYVLAIRDDFEVARKDFEALLPAHTALVDRGLLQVKNAGGVPAQ